MNLKIEDYWHLNSVPGYLHWDEGFALLTWAATWQAKGHIVDLGSYKGRSTVFLAAGSCISNRTVFAVDHFAGSEEHRAPGKAHEASLDYGPSLLPQFWMHVNRCGLQNQIKVKVADHVAEAARHRDESMALIFIDGEHDYESTLANFEAWRPKIAAGGLIAFHDNDDAHPGVRQCIAELTERKSLKRLANTRTIAAFVKN